MMKFVYSRIARTLGTLRLSIPTIHQLASGSEWKGIVGLTDNDPVKGLYADYISGSASSCNSVSSKS